MNTKGTQSGGACPNPNALKAYALGQHSKKDMDRVDQHVTTCKQCQTVLAKLDSAPDSLVDRLRKAKAPAAAPADSDGAAALVAGAKAITRGHPAPAAAAPSFTVHFPGYRILGPLGQGGFGMVYKVANERMGGRTEALKTIKDHGDAHLRDRLRQEIVAVAQLEHPNIIRAYDTGEAEGMLYFTMEFAAGCDLGELVRQRGAPLPTAEACTLICQAAEGLQYAHDKQIVHRDIKPNNLFLTEHGYVKILDLGLARLLGQTDKGDRLTGGFEGTYAYAAPEQQADTHNVTPAVDIFSLGCTLYFLLTRRHPSPGRLLVADPQLQLILDRMVATDPRERHPSAQAVVADLQRFRFQGPVSLATVQKPPAGGAAGVATPPSTVGKAQQSTAAKPLKTALKPRLVSPATAAAAPKTTGVARPVEAREQSSAKKKSSPAKAPPRVEKDSTPPTGLFTQARLFVLIATSVLLGIGALIYWRPELTPQPKKDAVALVDAKDKKDQSNENRDDKDKKGQSKDKPAVTPIVVVAGDGKSKKDKGNGDEKKKDQGKDVTKTDGPAKDSAKTDGPAKDPKDKPAEPQAPPAPPQPDEKTILVGRSIEPGHNVGGVAITLDKLELRGDKRIRWTFTFSNKSGRPIWWYAELGRMYAVDENGEKYLAVENAVRNERGFKIDEGAKLVYWIDFQEPRGDPKTLVGNFPGHYEYDGWFPSKVAVNLAKGAPQPLERVIELKQPLPSWDKDVYVTLEKIVIHPENRMRWYYSFFNKSARNMHVFVDRGNSHVLDQKGGKYLILEHTYRGERGFKLLVGEKLPYSIDFNGPSSDAQVLTTRFGKHGEYDGWLPNMDVRIALGNAGAPEMAKKVDAPADKKVDAAPDKKNDEKPLPKDLSGEWVGSFTNDNITGESQAILTVNKHDGKNVGGTLVIKGGPNGPVFQRAEVTGTFEGRALQFDPGKIVNFLNPGWRFQIQGKLDLVPAAEGPPILTGTWQGSWQGMLLPKASGQIKLKKQ